MIVNTIKVGKLDSDSVKRKKMQSMTNWTLTWYYDLDLVCHFRCCCLHLYLNNFRADQLNLMWANLCLILAFAKRSNQTNFLAKKIHNNRSTYGLCKSKRIQLLINAVSFLFTKSKESKLYRKDSKADFIPVDNWSKLVWLDAVC